MGWDGEGNGDGEEGRDGEGMRDETHRWEKGEGECNFDCELRHWRQQSNHDEGR